MKQAVGWIVLVLILSTGMVKNGYAGDFPFLTNALQKRFFDEDVYPHREVKAMIIIVTNTEIDSSRKTDSILYAWKHHQKLLDAFVNSGWQLCHVLDNTENAGSIEVVFEPRMNLSFQDTTVMKAFLNVCESDRLWNMMKYRGGSLDQYLNRVVSRVEECVREKVNQSD